jgi:hypothetical protein
VDYAKISKAEDLNLIVLQFFTNYLGSNVTLTLADLETFGDDEKLRQLLMKILKEVRKRKTTKTIFSSDFNFRVLQAKAFLANCPKVF